MRITFEQLYFLIEGPGKAMDLINEFIEERAAAIDRCHALVKEISGGKAKYTRNEERGTVKGIVFPGNPPADWKKPDKRGVSYPKKNSPWAQRLKDQEPHRDASSMIKEAFGIPTQMLCTKPDGSKSWREIGHWFRPCQFAYTAGEPPLYLMVIPNHAFYIAQAESEGWKVPDEVKAFKPVFEGCRQITRADWDILVMQRRQARTEPTA